MMWWIIGGAVAELICLGWFWGETSRAPVMEEPDDE